MTYTYTHETSTSSLARHELNLSGFEQGQFTVSSKSRSKEQEGEKGRTKEEEGEEPREEGRTYNIQVPACSEGPNPPSERSKGRFSGKTGSEKKYQNIEQAYVQTYKKVTKAACDYVDDLLDQHDIGDHSSRFFKHILSSGGLGRYKKHGGFVPFSGRLMQRKLPNTDWKALRDAGLIEVQRYIPYQRSRRFRVPFEIREQFESLNSFYQSGYVNLFTSTETQRTLKNETYKEDHNGKKRSVPDLVKDTMDTIQTSYINTEAVLLHIGQQKANLASAEAKLKFAEATGADESEVAEAEKAVKRHRGRLTTDQAAYHSIIGQGLRHVEGPVYAFTPAYRATRTGRLSAQHSLLQSCSREMKEAAFKEVPNMKNYDIKSSQMVILSEYFQRAGIESDWLDSYVENPRAKYEWAERAGLSVDTWKSCLYALLMGGSAKKSGMYTHDIWENIVKEYPDEEKAYEVLQQFKDVTAPLREALSEWHDYLVNEWYPSNERWNRAKNDVGMPIRRATFEKETGFKRALAAHMLQGREALFIHSLVLLSRLNQFDFEVVSHQHDGLVTIGEIPQEAIDLLKQDSAMEYVQLEEKSFT